MSAEGLFRTTFGGVPSGVWSAPGRVNLIGEHTDYTGGLVLPFAIDQRAWLAASPIAQPVIRLVSAQRPGGIVEIPLDLLAAGGSAISGWPAYVAGAVWAVRQHAPGENPGLELALDSTVPAGAGLSSSAAVECAVALAYSELTGRALRADQIARIAQRAENDFVGVPCGLMDQMASATCRPGHVLFFDVGNDTVQHIPFAPQTAGLGVLVLDTRAHHSLADGEYAARRESCERATRALGLASLRDIDDLPAALTALRSQPDGELLARRVRHVVAENLRVEQVVRALSKPQPDWPAIGLDMVASHRSLRDDYDVSSPELNTAVDAATAAGAVGARMTGGGFGGSAIALVPTDGVDEVTIAVHHAFAAKGFAAPVVMPVQPAGGARREA